jgi:putative ABC transport system permease protein
LDKIWQDFRYGMRTLRRTPGFTIVALLTLALGIGANTAIFSVVNAVLLRPLPFAESNQLISITEVDPAHPTLNSIQLSFTKYSAVHEQSRSLAAVSVYYPFTLSLMGGREPELISAARVSRDFFRTMDVSPALGRTFAADEDQPGGADVALISDGLWHSHFGADPKLVGQKLTLDGRNVTVVGILPASFRFPMQFPEPEIWLPRAFEIDFLSALQVHSGAGYLFGIARLGPGIGLSQAQADLDTINVRYRQQSGTFADQKFGIFLTPLEESLVGTLRPSLVVLLAAVAFVLLIACANVASLLLVRASTRSKEIAIRKALGASRWSLLRQLLSESLLLSLFGGMLGVGLAAALLPVLRLITPGAVPRLEQSSLDAKVLLFTLGISILTGLVSGLAPALQVSGRALHDVLKEGGRTSSAGGVRNRFRSVLVIAEVAVALILMTGAGLLIQSFARLMQVDPGFDASNVMTFPISLPKARYGEAALQAQFYQQVLARVRTLPGVQTAAFASSVPLAGVTPYIFFCPEGMACQGIGKDPVIAQGRVSAGYFESMRSSLLRGRLFTEQDVAGGLNVAIVNRSLAEHYWPGQDPLGKHLMNSRDRIPREIVGVVADAKITTLNADGFDQMFLPMAQAPWPSATLVVRSPMDPESLVKAVRQAFGDVDATLPVTGIMSLHEVVSNSVAQPRLIMQLCSAFAALALLLAVIGLYAVMAYSVNQRQQEMGVRMALGATPRDILRLVVGRGMGLTLTGIVIGVAGSFGIMRLLASLLFGTQATDPIAFSAAAMLLGVAAILASYVPARRATRLDPMLALRYE